jgi:hypothetical protein
VGFADDPVVPGTGSITVPIGTTAQQPAVPTAAMFRFNTTTGHFEGYDGATWRTFALGGAAVLSFSAGTTGFTPNIASTGAIVLGGILSIANGGTNATTASAALTNLGAAALAGSSTQVFNVAPAVIGTEAVPLAQAQANFAALAGLSTQVFNVATAVIGTEAVPLAQAQANFAALAGLSTQVFNVAPAVIGTEAVPLAQAQANFAALAGSSTQVFNVAPAVIGTEAVPLAQVQANFAALAGLNTQVFNVANAVIGTEAVPLAQVQANFAALNGNSGQVFNVANAVIGTEALPLAQVQANFAALAGNSGQVFNVANATTVTEAVPLGQLTAPSPNLLVNGSAEFGSLDWSLPTQAGPATGVNGEGTYFSIGSAVNGTYIAVSADYAVGPGVALALQAEIFASGLTAGQLAMDLEFLDASHTPIVANQAQSTVTADQPWTFLSNSATTPANTAYWHARFYMASATLTNGALRKIKVSGGTTPSPYSREADFPAMSTTFAALNGSFTQPFNVAPAAAGPQAVRLTQTIGGGATQYGNFTSQRAFGTVYINSSGRPLAVVISAEIPTGVNVTLSDGSNTYFYGGASNHGSSEGTFTFLSLVPTGASYFVFGASGAVLLQWFEY